MIDLSVYIDVLLVLNLYIDYILLYICSKLLSIKPKIVRLMLASALGAVSSLFIILPISNQLYSCLYSAIVALAISRVAFGKQNLIKNSLSYCLLNCMCCGITMLIWFTTKSNKVIINNNYIYFNVSPLLLIISTIVIYISASLIKKYITYKICQHSCKITIDYCNNSIILNCLIDTGNLLKDSITDKPIIIISKSSACNLLGINDFNTSELYDIKGFRLIPISSVSEESVLIGFKADNVSVELDDRIIDIDGIIAVSNNYLSNEYQGLVGAYALSLGEEYTHA